VTSTKTPVTVEKKAEVGALGSDNMMMYAAIIVLIVIILVVAMAMAGRKKPTSPPSGGWATKVPPPKPTIAPKAKPAAPQVSATATPPAPVPSGEPGKVKIARIKCPKCKEVMDIKSSKRPLEVRCDNCNAKLLLKK